MYTLKENKYLSLMYTMYTSASSNITLLTLIIVLRGTKSPPRRGVAIILESRVNKMGARGGGGLHDPLCLQQLWL
jgi:hypothetical protein